MMIKDRELKRKGKNLKFNLDMKYKCKINLHSILKLLKIKHLLKLASKEIMKTLN